MVNLGNSGWRHALESKSECGSILRTGSAVIYLLVRPTPLPARFPGLACVALIVVASTSPATAKTLPTAAAARRIGLRFSLINLQRAASKIGAVQGGDRLIGFAGVGHLDESKASRASGFAVSDNADALHGAMRLEQAAKLWLGGAVR
jgi:hypothetical protein